MSEIAKLTQPAIPGMLPADIDSVFGDPTQATGVFNEGQLEREKERLLGIPHVITRVTYHSDFKKSERGYVTIEGNIAPPEFLQEALDRKWVPDRAMPVLFRPYEVVKYNDGSTGIRRQITWMLHVQQLIDVGDVTDMADFDRPWTEWRSFSQNSLENNGDDKIAVPDIIWGNSNRKLAIPAFHGLRVSHMDEWDTDIFYLG